MSSIWNDAEVIHTYTRAQAIADGVLVDVSATAREAGFTWPVAVSAGAWGEAVAWDADNAAAQDESGRLWDVLTMAAHAIRQGGSADRRAFPVLRIPNMPEARQAQRVTLQLVAGSGEAGESVITIMCTDED